MGKRMKRNEMELIFDAIPENEGLARAAAAFFAAAALDLNMEELGDIKTAVSEAVTNCVIHGYREKSGGKNKVVMRCAIEGDCFYTEISDKGKGIEDIQKAMEPMYTTMPEEDRSGMGFSFMEAFMDELTVESELGQGTTVKMMKRIGIKTTQKENEAE